MVQRDGEVAVGNETIETRQFCPVPNKDDGVVVADHPGAWFLHCTQPGHVEAGERMLVVYEDHPRTTPPEPERGIAGLTLWEYGLGRGRPAASARGTEPRTFVMTLGGGMMGSEVWTINAKRYPQTDPVPCRKGDRVGILLRNMSMEAHPMHLHGQSFRLLAANGVPYTAPLVKDVVDVEAHTGPALIEIDAQNPGDWFFHCHKPMHMMGGMIALVKIA